MEEFDTYTLLVAEIGEKAAQKVFSLFQGSRVPFSNKVLKFYRNIQISHAFQNGASYDALSRAYGLTTRQIRNITSRDSRARRKEILDYLNTL